MASSLVISVGGSIIVPAGGIDAAYVKKFRSFILNQVKTGKKFYLVIGGGTTAREYLRAAATIANFGQAAGDWLGISATRLNAQFIKTIFGRLTHSEVIIDPTKKIKTSKSIVIVAGYKPGWSTDYCAALIAKANHAKTIINLSNIDYAYDRDPRKYPEAKKLKQVTWPEFRKIVGNVWRPGLNAPFDPIASRLAAKLKMKVIIANGHNLNNLSACLNGKKFKGTVID